jgi:hypothetical protein
MSFHSNNVGYGTGSGHAAPDRSPSLANSGGGEAKNDEGRPGGSHSLPGRCAAIRVAARLTVTGSPEHHDVAVCGGDSRQSARIRFAGAGLHQHRGRLGFALEKQLGLKLETQKRPMASYRDRSPWNKRRLTIEIAFRRCGEPPQVRPSCRKAALRYR